MEGRAIGSIEAPAVSPAARRPWGAALKVGISIALLAVLLSRVDRGRMGAALRDAWLPLLLLCIPLYAVGQILSTLRWQVLLSAEEVRVPFWQLVLLYSEGMFFNLFLPTAVGGDMVRGYRIWHLTRAGEGALASILVERITGFVAMGGMATVARSRGPRGAVGFTLVVLASRMVTVLFLGLVA